MGGCCSRAVGAPPRGRKARELLSELLRGTNGAVSGAMRDMGVDYPLNYGVSVADIRRAAAPFAPDGELARELYPRPEREARIAATYLADPAPITVDDADFWAAGMVNGEIAGHVALLAGRSPDVQRIMERWLSAGDELLHYAAVMCGARAAQGAELPLDIPRLLPLLRPGTLPADRAIAAFLGRVWRNFPSARPALEPFLTHTAPLWPRLKDGLDMECALQ